MNNKLCLIGIFMILLVGIVFAFPGIPHQFYGSVTYNDAAASDGLTVDVYLGEDIIVSTVTKDGQYGYDPTFKVTDPESVREGMELKFYVNGIDTGITYTFVNAGVTELDLSASGGSSDDGGDDTGSSSPLIMKGGSSPLVMKGGGSPTPIVTPPTPPAPTPEQLEEASAVSDETSGEETVGQESNEQTQQNVFQRFFSAITGSFVGPQSTGKGIGIMFIIIAIGLGIFMGVNKAKRRK